MHQKNTGRFTRRELLAGSAAALGAAALGGCASGAPRRLARRLGFGTGVREPAAGLAVPPSDDPFAHLDGLAQAGLVHRGEASALELCEAAIARIERWNPSLNAVVTEDYERALARARALESEAAAGPFAGVPFLIKDLTEVGGLRTTYGSRLFADFVPEHSHEWVRRAEAAGLIVLGKTNTPEFGLLPSTQPLLFGPTRNPWHLAHDPGGSSGGTAAAVAAGLVPFAQGSDGGGSIRIPASNCGLFGLKVSRARQPGPRERHVDISVRHCLSRSVRDSAALLQLTHRTAAEGSKLPPPVAPDGTRLRRLRVGLSSQSLYGSPVHPECEEAARVAAGLCEDLGHHVEEAAPTIEGEAFLEHFLAIWSASAAGVVEEVRQRTGAPPPRAALEPATWGFVARFAALPEDALPRAVEFFLGVERELVGFFARYDVWLTPVLGRPPARVGELAPQIPFERLLPAVTDYVPFTPVANAAGCPAMSVPLHWTARGLPIGSHFMAPVGDEATLLLLAAELEAARPWSRRWPPLATEALAPDA